MPTFSDDVVDAVLAHMNGEHNDDNLVIARAFGSPDATASTMATLDEEGATWIYSSPGARRELVVPWSTVISERKEIRREIVRIYERACTTLGIEPREH